MIIKRMYTIAKNIVSAAGMREVLQNGMIGCSRKTAAFAKGILDKYTRILNYQFDPVSLIFLQRMADGDGMSESDGVKILLTCRLLSYLIQHMGQEGLFSDRHSFLVQQLIGQVERNLEIIKESASDAGRQLNRCYLEYQKLIGMDMAVHAQVLDRQVQKERIYGLQEQIRQLERAQGQISQLQWAQGRISQLEHTQGQTSQMQRVQRQFGQKRNTKEQQSRNAFENRIPFVMTHTFFVNLNHWIKENRISGYRQMWKQANERQIVRHKVKCHMQQFLREEDFIRQEQQLSDMLRQYGKETVLEYLDQADLKVYEKILPVLHTLSGLPGEMFSENIGQDYRTGSSSQKYKTADSSQENKTADSGQKNRMVDSGQKNRTVDSSQKNRTESSSREYRMVNGRDLAVRKEQILAEYREAKEQLEHILSESDENTKNVLQKTAAQYKKSFFEQVRANSNRERAAELLQEPFAETKSLDDKGIREQTEEDREIFSDAEIELLLRDMGSQPVSAEREQAELKLKLLAFREITEQFLQAGSMAVHQETLQRIKRLLDRDVILRGQQLEQYQKADTELSRIIDKSDDITKNMLLEKAEEYQNIFYQYIRGESTKQIAASTEGIFQTEQKNASGGGTSQRENTGVTEGRMPRSNYIAQPGEYKELFSDREIALLLRDGAAGSLSASAALEKETAEYKLELLIYRVLAGQFLQESIQKEDLQEKVLQRKAVQEIEVLQREAVQKKEVLQKEAVQKKELHKEVLREKEVLQKEAVQVKDLHKDTVQKKEVFRKEAVQEKVLQKEVLHKKENLQNEVLQKETRQKDILKHETEQKGNQQQTALQKDTLRKIVWLLGNIFSAGISEGEYEEKLLLSESTQQADIISRVQTAESSSSDTMYNQNQDGYQTIETQLIHILSECDEVTKNMLQEKVQEYQNLFYRYIQTEYQVKQPDMIQEQAEGNPVIFSDAEIKLLLQNKGNGTVSEEQQAAEKKLRLLAYREIAEQFLKQGSPVLQRDKLQKVVQLVNGMNNRLYSEKGILERDKLQKDILERNLLEKNLLEGEKLQKDLLERKILENDLLERDLLERDLLERDLLERDLFGKGVFERKEVFEKKDALICNILEHGSLLERKLFFLTAEKTVDDMLIELQKTGSAEQVDQEKVLKDAGRITTERLLNAIQPENETRVEQILNTIQAEQQVRNAAQEEQQIQNAVQEEQQIQSAAQAEQRVRNVTEADQLIRNTTRMEQMQNAEQAEQMLNTRQLNNEAAQQYEDRKRQEYIGGLIQLKRQLLHLGREKFHGTDDWGFLLTDEGNRELLRIIQQEENTIKSVWLQRVQQSLTDIYMQIKKEEFGTEISYSSSLFAEWNLAFRQEEWQQLCSLVQNQQPEEKFRLSESAQQTDIISKLQTAESSVFDTIYDQKQDRYQTIETQLAHILSECDEVTKNMLQEKVREYQNLIYRYNHTEYQVKQPDTVQEQAEGNPVTFLDIKRKLFLQNKGSGAVPEERQAADRKLRLLAYRDIAEQFLKEDRLVLQRDKLQKMVQLLNGMNSRQYSGKEILERGIPEKDLLEKNRLEKDTLEKGILERIKFGQSVLVNKEASVQKNVLISDILKHGSLPERKLFILAAEKTVDDMLNELRETGNIGQLEMKQTSEDVGRITMKRLLNAMHPENKTQVKKNEIQAEYIPKEIRMEQLPNTLQLNKITEQYIYRKKHEQINELIQLKNQLLHLVGKESHGADAWGFLLTDEGNRELLQIIQQEENPVKSVWLQRVQQLLTDVYRQIKKEGFRTEMPYSSSLFADWNPVFRQEEWQQLCSLVQAQQHITPQAERKSFLESVRRELEYFSTGSGENTKLILKASLEKIPDSGQPLLLTQFKKDFMQPPAQDRKQRQLMHENQMMHEKKMLQESNHPLFLQEDAIHYADQNDIAEKAIPPETVTIVHMEQNHREHEAQLQSIAREKEQEQKQELQRLESDMLDYQSELREKTSQLDQVEQKLAAQEKEMRLIRESQHMIAKQAKTAAERRQMFHQLKAQLQLERMRSGFE